MTGTIRHCRPYEACFESHRLWLPALALVIAAAACTVSPAPETPTPVVIPTQNRTYSQLLTATATAIPSPTSTPARSATATAVPTPDRLRRCRIARRAGRPDARRRILRFAVPEPPPHQDVHQTQSPALLTWGPGLAYSRLFRFTTGQDAPSPNTHRRMRPLRLLAPAGPGHPRGETATQTSAGTTIEPVNGRRLTAG